MARLFAEKNIYIWFILILTFFFFTYNKDLAMIYIAFIILDYFIKTTYPTKIRVDLNTSPGNTMNALVVGIIAFVVFMMVTTFMATFLQAALNFAPEQGFSALWQQIVRHSASTTKPIFEGNKYVVLFLFGVVIATIETRTLIARLYDWIAEMINVSIYKLSVKLVALWVVISGIFTAFHFQAKGLTDNVGLLATFIFCMISLALITIFKESESATYFHIIWNSIIVLQTVFKGAAIIFAV